MQSTISLGQFVKKRTGVPMGHPDSLQNMLNRSLGAPSFAGFWLYWNPIWGYYLSRYVMQPLNTRLPRSFALWGTFVVSGLLHDIAVMLIFQQPSYMITSWFSVMGMVVLVTERLCVGYPNTVWVVRAALNVALIMLSYVLALWCLALFDL